MSVPDCIEVGPADAGTCVVLLHGLGADGHDLEGLVPHLQCADAGNWQFIFPNAPTRPVTINGGMEMRAWYDIDPSGGLDSGRDDIAHSRDSILALLEARVTAGTPPQRIILGGFSQGGVIALEAMLAWERRLGGLMALSTYLHDQAGAAERCGLANLELPVFMAHGLMDPMIPIQRAVASRVRLQELGFPVEWHEYPMGHEICLDEIRALSYWLDARLS